VAVPRGTVRRPDAGYQNGGARQTGAERSRNWQVGSESRVYKLALTFTPTLLAPRAPTSLYRVDQ
jgi:hypothetical protein